MKTTLNADFSLRSHLSFLRRPDHLSIHPLSAGDVDVGVSFQEPKRSQFFELFWIQRGSSSVRIDAEGLELKDRTIYCLSPGQVRQMDWSADLVGYYISICPDFFHLLQNRFEIASIFDFTGALGQIEIGEELEGELERILYKIREELTGGSPLKSDLLRAWFNVFMLYLTQNLSGSNLDVSYTSDRELLKRFLALLPNHHSEKKMVSEYAEILCVTPNYLNSVVKKITGFPASHHIQQHLVMEAKRYAMYSQLRMKEIANRLGFVDYAHFSKFFKNYAGMNFSSYLKEIKKNVA